MQKVNFDGLRADFDAQAGRSLSMPIAGAIVWSVAGIAALLLPAWPATLVLLFGTGAIFPVALLLARILREKLLDNTNPLSRLMGLCVLMVNLLWAVHITLLLRNISFLPLTLGIGLGLHWIVFSWIVDHPLGIVHAVLRTVLVTALWWLFPAHPITAVAAGVVVAYGYSIYMMATRSLNGRSALHH